MSRRTLVNRMTPPPIVPSNVKGLVHLGHRRGHGGFRDLIRPGLRGGDRTFGGGVGDDRPGQCGFRLNKNLFVA